MNTREEFGSYVLLKKLQEDALGETFRAGQMGAQGLDRVVLLRVFNGEGIDPDHLAKGLEARRPIQEVLRSPNIGLGVDLGRVGRVPYVAYDYISGTDLASLMVQSVRARNPIPIDHALLIGERLALGLTVAQEIKLNDQRIAHGCLLPQLVTLSSEGETRVLGFEAGPSLREQASGPLGSAVARYLSPESQAGEPLRSSDDVYSLGVILFELLTGRALPAGLVDIAVVEAAVRDAGRPRLPTGIAALIQKSLAPAEERLPDAATWHKALSKMMVDAQLTPTTFNLAFYMHSLFREEIELESQELEVEKTLNLQPGSGVQDHATTAIPMDILRGDVEAAKARAAGAGGAAGAAAATAAPQRSGSNKGLIVGIAAAAVIALLAVAYFVFLRPRLAGEPAVPDATTAAVASDEPVTDPLATGDAGALGEGVEGEAKATASQAQVDDLRAQLDQILEEKTAAMEANLRAQYDQRIRDLQKDLDAAQRTAEQEAAAQKVQRDKAAQAKAAKDLETQDVSAGATAAKPGDATRTAGGTERAPAGTGDTAAGGAGTLPAAGTQTADTGTAGGAPKTTTQPSAQPGADTTAAKKPVTKAVAEPEPPAAEPVRRGELVSPGPGVIAPKLTRQPSARFPPMARRLNKTADVTVKVLVDETGKVIESELAGERAGFGFDEAALQAASTAVFEPATKNGVKVKMWSSFKISFR